MYYPQGSRSKTPELEIQPQDLKHGAFTAAIQSQAKILPIKIVGSHKILRPWGIADVGTVRVIRLPAFEVKDVQKGKEHFCSAMNKRV